MAPSNNRPGAGSDPVAETAPGAQQVRGKRGSWIGDRSSADAESVPGVTRRDEGSGSGSGVSRTPGGSGGSPRGSAGGGTPRSRGNGPRRIRLTLARLDPFSVMKLSFLISIGIGIATVVCVAVLWNLVNAMGVWDKLDQLGRDLNSNKPLPFMEYFAFTKMLSYATIISFINVVIMTALGTLFAFLYNIIASMLGGLKMTFTDE